jgi:class 3 adenylate cyclase/tetratricopeptide (TPR) repeat protein
MCGGLNRPTARYCGQCGKPLDSEPLQLGEGTPEARPMVDPLEQGERKQVTILFADVRGSTQLIEALDPEMAVVQLGPAVLAMADAVVRFGGVVNRNQGDGIMALFGAPFACEDHAVRGCLAARAMIDSVRRLADANIAIRVGLDSGEVVVYPTGCDSSDYDVGGVIAHLASRMERHAAPGTVLLTDRTAKLARGYVDLVPLGPTVVDGLSKPVETFNLLSATARPSWEVRCSVDRLNRFVGRATELAQLSAALGRAALGRGQVVTIVADAGFGKSRLVHEFLSALPTGTWRVLRVAATSYAELAPYRLAAELLRSLLGVNAIDDRTEVTRKLDQTLAIIGDHKNPFLAPLRSLLDLPMIDEEWTRLAPPERRNKLITALRNTVLRESALRPVLLFIDDYHWIDQSSAEVLDAIVDGLGAARLLMVVTGRPDRRPHWRSRSYCLELHLPPLEPESAELLLSDVIVDSAGTAPMRKQIIDQAGGVPLFIEELARSLPDGNALLADEPSHLNPEKHLGRANLPASVKGTIAARIDRLPPARRRLLQVASVIGNDVPFELLLAVADLPKMQLELELAELQRAEFLYELHFAFETEYTFIHTLIQAVAYEGILRKHRRDLHARVLVAMENRFAGRVNEVIERLADHALRGELWDAAASYALSSGDRAIERWSWREAIAFFEKAIAALANLPDGAERVKRSIEARLRLRVALPAAADLPRWIQILDEARELAGTISDSLRLAEIDTSRCIALTKMGLLNRAIDAGRQGYATADKLSAPGMLLNATFALAQALWYSGEFLESEQLLVGRLKAVRSELRLARTGTTGTASLLHLVCLSKTYAIRGEFGKAFATIEEARQVADETRRPFDMCYARVGKGFCLLLHEEAVAAVGELEEALRLARTNDIALLIPSSMRYLGPAYAMTGRVAEANDLLQEAIERTKAHGLIGMRIWSSAALASVQVTSTVIPKAIETLLGTLELADQYGFRPVRAQLMRLLGNLHEKGGNGPADRAEEWYRSGIQLSCELGMRPEAAYAIRDLSQFLRRVGRNEEATIQQAAAKDLRRAMGLINLTQIEEGPN